MQDAEQFVLERYREISLLESASGVLQWDMETVMPPEGSPLRGQQLGALASVVHQKETAPDYVDAALKLENSVHAPRLRRKILSTICVDAAFVAKLSEAQVRCQQEWKIARKERNFAKVKASLRELVELQREWARRYKAHPISGPAVASLTPFEVAFEPFEPGFGQARLESLFGKLGPELSRRIPEIVQRQKALRAVDSATHASLTMPLAEQEKLCRRITEALGFSFERGRLDRSAHPFCGGSPEDTRITVRYLESDFTNAVSSLTHETGHALYEQGLPKELLHTPAGVAASYGVHESQSRFVENQIGRSMAFCEYLGRLTDRSPDILYSHLNRVEPSLIRVDADEVTYNLHILIRLDIERRLLNGELEVDDIPRVWNENYRKFLGVEVPHDGDGCMQDVHWYGGAFGYFATYAIGNLLAAALFGAFRSQHPDWEKRVAAGEFAFVRDFLRDRVHRHASLRDSPGTIRQALGGQELSVDPFLRYVDEKYLTR